MPEKTSRFYYGYVIVAISAIIGAIAFGNMRSFGVFLDPLIQAFGWSRGATSMAVTIQALVTGFMAILAGKLSDRFGPRIVLTVSGLLIGAGYILCSFINERWQFYLIQGSMVGVGLAGIMVPLTSLVVRWFTQRMGLMNGLVNSGIGLGTMVVPPLATWIIEEYDWRKAFLVLGCGCLVLITGFSQFLKRPSLAQIESAGDNFKLKTSDSAHDFSFREAIKTRTYWMLSIMFFTDVFAVNSMMTHIVIHTEDLLASQAVDPRTAATAATMVLSAAAGVSIFGRIAAGAVSDRVGVRSTIGIGLGMLSLSFIWLLFAKQLWMLYLFAVVFGISGWCVGSVLSPLVAEYFGLKSHGVILGAVNFTGILGGSIGPLLTGIIFDKMKSYNVAFILCASMTTLGIILLQFLKKPGGRYE